MKPSLITAMLSICIFPFLNLSVSESEFRFIETKSEILKRFFLPNMVE